MHSKRLRFWYILMGVLVMASLLLTAAPKAQAQGPAPGKQVKLDGPGTITKGALQVKYPVHFDTSKPLRNLKPGPLAPESAKAREILRAVQMLPLPKALKGGSGSLTPDQVQSSHPVGTKIGDPITSFDGISNSFGVLPPDTNGDIGYDPSTGNKYYFQIVNLGFEVWDVTDPTNPTVVIDVTDNNAMWDGFGGICENHNDGDPIVLYDHLANRWLFSQFALDFDTPEFHQCIAVSASADPTGAWYRYDYLVSTTKMNDYPHFGVWPDAYYMSANQFDGQNFNWAGAGAWAFERDAMLAGNAARMVYFDIGSKTLDYGGMLPSDLDGQAPPEGTPNYFVEWDDSEWLGDPQDTLRIWEFHVDWDNPDNSTFGADANFTPNAMVATLDVDPDMCGGSRNCIPQPGGTALDAIADRLMYRLAFRMWDDLTFSLFSNHTVDVDGNDHAGIHWFELTYDGTAWTMAQEGVYAPDSDHRWMGSIAADKDHDLLLGFSLSSTSTYPSVGYTGRLAGDTAGEMTQGENLFVSGGGSQSHSSGRWGDYSMMSVDPADDCTFWYTQEYYPSDSSATWYTRIGAFKFASCTNGPTGTLTGTVTDASTGDPIANAKVEITDLSMTTYTDDSGNYTFANVPTGDHTVAASAFGYNGDSATVTINDGETTTQDFALDPKPWVTITLEAYDDTTGWPLYAMITVSDDPNSPYYTDPLTGSVTVSLPEDTYTFTFSALTGGYFDVSEDVSVSDGMTITASMSADLDACTAPGYSMALKEDFEAWPLTDWAIVDNLGGEGLVWDSSAAYGDGNYTDGAGLAADVNSDANDGVPYDTELISPVINVADLQGDYTLHYKANFQVYSGNEALDLDISTDGGATWTNLLHWTEDHGNLYGTPGEAVDLDLTDALNGATSFQLRWRYYTSESSPWDWYAQIDEVRMGVCQPVAAGLSVGSAYDANTGDPVAPFSVTNETSGELAVVLDTSADSSTPDFMYFVGVNDGDQLLASTTAPGYGEDSFTVTLETAGTNVWNDVMFPAPMFNVDPGSLDFNVLQLSGIETQTLTLQNVGTWDGHYDIVAINGTPPTLNPAGLTTPHRLVGEEDLGRLSLSGAAWRGTLPNHIQPLAAGDALASWDPNLPYAWGLGYDRGATSGPVWVGNVSSMGGDPADYSYEVDGTPTGNSIDISSFEGGYAADMAYDDIHHTLWQMGVVGDTCIHELDPATLTVTGEKICPDWSVSQRGLAFDPLTDTFFAGGWNEGVVYRVGRSGEIIESVNVSLPIAALAYNPMSGHLFALINADTTDASVYDVYVLDVNDNYNIIGAFDVVDGGTPVFGDSYGQAGMGIDCDGHLWIVDQDGQKVYEVDSGESGVCEWRADWLTAEPASGDVSAGGSADVQVTVSGYRFSYGEYDGYLLIPNNSPYGSLIVPVHVTVQGYVPLRGDFNGDGKMDIAIFRPDNHTWYIAGQGSVAYGGAGDVPVPADYNGDGEAEIAVFRPDNPDHGHNSTWHVLGYTGPFVYGQPGDVPVPGDYNGDGEAEIAVFRPDNPDHDHHSTWHVYGYMGPFIYGDPGDIPVPADYNGDGKVEIAVFRPDNPDHDHHSTWHVYGYMGPFVYGEPGDIPVPADYNGDGKAEIAVFRPSTGEWFIYGVMGGFTYGQEGDIPVPGDYNGDGKAEIAVFRPSTGKWYILGLGAYDFGSDGDIPAAPTFIPGLTP